MRAVFLILLAGLLPFFAQAQTRPPGIEAESVIEELMFNAQGNREEAFRATSDLSSCSAYFDVFAANELSKPAPDMDAVAGLQTMKKDTAVVAALIWSQHSTDPAGDVEELTRAARLDEIGRLNALGGTTNVPFLQRYDNCSQTFLFSQFFMGTAQDQL